MGFNTIPIKTPASFFIDIYELILKFMYVEKAKDLEELKKP